MVERIHGFDIGADELGTLVRSLRGLFVEADPHDPAVRSDFELYWSPIDAEYESRTESWAPPGSANDDALARSLTAFRLWVDSVVEADPTNDHR